MFPGQGTTCPAPCSPTTRTSPRRFTARGYTAGGDTRARWSWRRRVSGSARLSRPSPRLPRPGGATTRFQQRPCRNRRGQLLIDSVYDLDGSDASPGITAHAQPGTAPTATDRPVSCVVQPVPLPLRDVVRNTALRLRYRRLRLSRDQRLCADRGRTGRSQSPCRPDARSVLMCWMRRGAALAPATITGCNWRREVLHCSGCHAPGGAPCLTAGWIHNRPRQTPAPDPRQWHHRLSRQRRHRPVCHRTWPDHGTDLGFFTGRWITRPPWPGAVPVAAVRGRMERAGWRPTLPLLTGITIPPGLISPPGAGSWSAAWTRARAAAS